MDGHTGFTVESHHDYHHDLFSDASDLDTRSFCKKMWKGLEELSSFPYRVVSITKNALKTYVYAGHPKEGQTLLSISSQLSVFSVVNVFLTPWCMYQEMKSCYKAGKKDDVEGVGLGVASTLSVAGSGVDQFMTFFSGVSEINQATPQIAWFGTVLPPLGLGLTALGITTESYKLYRTNQIINDLKEVTSEHNLKTFLDKHLGTDPNPKKRILNAAVLKRRSGTNEFAKIKGYSGNEMFIRDVKTFEKRKFRSGCINWTIMAVTLVALCLFFTPVGPLVPFAILFGIGVVKLCLMIYNKKYLRKGLDLKTVATNLDDAIFQLGVAGGKLEKELPKVKVSKGSTTDRFDTASRELLYNVNRLKKHDTRFDQLHDAIARLTSAGIASKCDKAIYNFDVLVGNLERVNGKLEAVLQSNQCSTKELDKIVPNIEAATKSLQVAFSKLV